MADQQSSMEFDAEKVPEVLPILPLYDAALFPKMVLPLVVMQGESVKLVDEAMAKDRIIGLIVSKKTDEKNVAGKGRPGQGRNQRPDPQNGQNPGQSDPAAGSGLEPI